MSRVQTARFRNVGDARDRLHEGVRRTAQRGRSLASLGVGMLCLAALVGGLFIVAIKDALFVLPASARLALLLLLVLGSVGVFAVLAIRPWLNQQFYRAAGQQIDLAACAPQQPVTLGLSLKQPMDDDSLALMLLQRAERRASDVTRSVTPAQAYPTQRLRGPMTWLALALGFWLLLAIVLPSQVAAMFSRVAMPWGDAPPFSMTQMQPQWTPKPPMAGEDVTLTVEPTGRMPESVDWVVLDDAGKEAERFTMRSDGQGGFSYRLKRVDAPIDFRLEAFGRHTRTYTINPTPRPSVEQTSEDTTDASPTEPDGTTQFDPDKAARRDVEAHRDWPGIRADLEKLLGGLAEAQAEAEGVDAADAEALQALADKLANLTEQAEAIAEQIASMQGELPEDASALLSALTEALTNMQSGALPAPPTATQGTPTDGQPTPAEWLDQAAEAAKSDRRQIGKGVGPSDRPTDSGTASGQPGEGPDLRDPDAIGTYSETAQGGDTGPLPEAVMRQVPPSYREHVAKYFERLAEDQAKP